MWRNPDNLLNAIFNINAPFGSDYFVLISHHNFGVENYVPRGDKWLHSHFSGEKIYYIVFFSAYPGKGEIWLWGENGSITPTCIPQKDEQKNI
jgi:hypothetical protein